MRPELQKFVHVEIQKNICIITMDNPPVNALSLEGYAQLIQAFDRVKEDLTISVVLLTSAGERTFCAGSDINELGPRETSDLGYQASHARLVRGAVESVFDCPVPVIACVNGPAVGVGVALIASCDMVIATDDAFLALPEIDVGVIGGGAHLTRLVPEQMARLMMYTARRVLLSELVLFGTVSTTVPFQDLREEGLRLAHEIASKDSTVLRLAKKSRNTAELAGMGVIDAFKFEQELLMTLATTPSSKVARKKFLGHDK